MNSDSQHEHAHHGGPKIYLMILGVLIVLTVITVLAAGVNFGSTTTNVIIAMVIASIKASLVALFFMHLRWDKPLNATIFVGGLCFLGIMLAFTFMDNTTRVEVRPQTPSIDMSAPADENPPDEASAAAEE